MRRQTDWLNVIQSLFPVVKWSLGLIAVACFAGLVQLYNMKIVIVELKKELQSEQRINFEQDIKINETYGVMRDIASEQAKIAQSIENLSINLTESMKRIAKDSSETRQRMDKYIGQSRN